MKAPYRILTLSMYEPISLGDPIPTLREAQTVMVWKHNRSATCDMVIVDAENRPIKVRRNTGWRTAKTLDVRDSVYWQRQVDEALSGMKT